MKLFRDFEEIEFNPNTIVTLGTFDGVHKGHRKVISQLLEIAEKENLRPILITFDPHPQITLQKEGRPPVRLLTNINERVNTLRNVGLPNVLIITFSYEFSQTPAEVFIEDYLCKKIGLKKILIGYDHMFGKNRGGDSDLLDKLSTELNFEVERIDALIEGEIAISSTKIRAALQESKVEIANEMLGYDYFIEGNVVQGEGRGKTIGFPTANIVPPDKHKLMPGNGVYFVSSQIDGKKVFGMANIGIRPTFTNDLHTTLEVHFLDFDQDLYGKSLFVSFHKFLRNEKKFSSAAELIEQIEKDKEIALELQRNF